VFVITEFDCRTKGYSVFVDWLSMSAFTDKVKKQYKVQKSSSIGKNKNTSNPPLLFVVI